MDVQRGLAGAGAEHDPRRLDEIAQVEHAVEEIDPFLAELVHAQEELDAPVAVLDVCEGDLAHGAHGADAPCQGGAHLRRRLALRGSLLRGLERRYRLGAGVGAFGAQRERLDALLAQCIDLF